MYPDNIKVRVKLCGNCNPVYDVNILLKDLRQRYPRLNYVYTDEEDFDLYMVINGCQVSCVKIPEVNCPKIIVSGYSINGKNVREEMLIDCIGEAITNNKHEVENEECGNCRSKENPHW